MKTEPQWDCFIEVISINGEVRNTIPVPFKLFNSWFEIDWGNTLAIFKIKLKK